jgi:hypothetical protein
MAVNVASDGGFFLHIVTANLNRLDAGMGLGYLRGFAGRLPVLLVSAAAGVAVAWRRKEPARWLLGPFLAGGFVSALAVLKAGSNVNYFFELLAAAALAVGFMVASLERRPFLLGTFVLLLTAQTLAQTTETLLFLRGLETRAAQRAEVARLETLIREADGPVLADEWMGLLPLQGKMLSFQPFELSQLARAGRWDQRPFVESLLAGRFPLVLIHAPASDPRRVGSRWTPGMLEAFRSAYTVSEVVDETLVLRPAASGRGAPPGV